MKSSFYLYNAVRIIFTNEMGTNPRTEQEIEKTIDKIMAAVMEVAADIGGCTKK